VAVDPQDESSIEHGLLRLLERQETFRDWLAHHRERILAEFERHRYVEEYRDMVMASA
jgi:hypothetical protein